jgi:hypothetical protein
MAAKITYFNRSAPILQIEGLKAFDIVSINDITGKQHLSFEVQDAAPILQTVDMRSFPQGLYFVSVADKTRSFTVKVSKS